MIRINLLPVRQVKKAKAGQRQLILFVLGFLVEAAVLVVLYESKSSEVDEVGRVVSQLESEIAGLKKEVGDFDQLKAQHDLLTKQQKIIVDLQKGKTGPVGVMRELSDILTAGKGPTVDQGKYEQLVRRNPAAGYNQKWNPNRLWLQAVTEKDGLLSIQGKAKDYDDVAEFSKRISLSEFFTDDFLEKNDQMVDGDLGIKVVRFSLRCRAK
jgi:type IV pilus assembly protein PilN